MRRLRSSDNTSSVSARSNKHTKLTKAVSKNTNEDTHKSSHKVSSKDQVNQKLQSHVLASVTSNSTCSVDYRDENIIGISSKHAKFDIFLHYLKSLMLLNII